MSDLPFHYPDESPANPAAPTPKCRWHKWVVADDRARCVRCGASKNLTLARRGRNNRSRGNRAELAVARLYGGEKTGPLGQPEDIRGAEWRTQVKTHQRLPPAEWRKVFAGMAAQHDGRTPRLLLRFLPGQGVPADDYFVVCGRDWLEKFGRDE